ncbi:hypothetical protein COCON_G00124460 [Conger conger]|uniref:Nucleoporin NUP42 n=1 Tax=Conger conger TaxID=82655 RepID=A0A9Q1DCQ2_CONCO|nr:hypothetical protein COCON_G00124460 [Conger conger]
MTVCNFFLQGRCRYGEKCWNEHPRGGGGYGSYSRPPAQSSSNRGGGGFGNKVWVNPSQRSSSFPKGGSSDWGRGAGEDSSFSFSNQNRFSALNSQQISATTSQGNDNDKYVETVSRDMEVWASSGQWPFSCYSAGKASISGFTELAPEELRLEYYTSQASGTLQHYANAVQQLASQWRSRVQELTNPNSTTRAALIAELNSPPSASLGFPSAGSGFSAGGSHTAGASGFGSAAQTGPASFGSAPTAASFSFSNPTSFANPSPSKDAPAGLPAGRGRPSWGADQLFTPQGDLSAEELKEFTERRFTLGQVPLRPPPADLLVV